MRPFVGGVWKCVARAASERAPQGGYAIDIGGGPGTILRELRKLRPDLHLTTTDIDPRMIGIASRKSHGQSIDCMVASMDTLPFPDQSIDIVVSSFAFHHVSRDVQKATFREVQRVLRRGGAFLLCDFSVPSNKPWWMSLQWWKYIEPSIGPQLRWQLFDLAQEAGASIETLRTFYNCISLHLITFPHA